MKIRGITIMALALLLVIAAGATMMMTTTTSTMAYAQTATTTTTPPPGAPAVAADQQALDGTYLHQYVLDDLANAELISVQVFENGRMILVFKLSDENERRMVIRTESPITPEAGYIFKNKTIYTPEGSELVFELRGGERRE